MMRDVESEIPVKKYRIDGSLSFAVIHVKMGQVVNNRNASGAKAVSVVEKSNVPLAKPNESKWSNDSKRRIEILEAITSEKSDEFWKKKVSEEKSKVETVQRRGRVAAIFKSGAKQKPIPKETIKNPVSSAIYFKNGAKQKPIPKEAIKDAVFSGNEFELVSQKHACTPTKRVNSEKNSKDKFLNSLMKLTVDLSSDEDNSSSHIPKSGHHSVSKKSKKSEDLPNERGFSSCTGVANYHNYANLSGLTSKSRTDFNISSLTKKLPVVDRSCSSTSENLTTIYTPSKELLTVNRPTLEVITISDSDSEVEYNHNNATSLLEETTIINEDSESTIILDYETCEDNARGDELRVNLSKLKSEECDKWRQKFSTYVEKVNNFDSVVSCIESSCCDDVPHGLLTIFHINLKCESAVIDGLRFLETLISPESKLPEDIIKLLIGKILSSTDEVLLALCFKILTKQFVFHGWNCNIDMWRLIEQTAEQFIDSSVDIKLRESSYQLFSFLVSILEDCWFKCGKGLKHSCLAVRFLNCIQKFHKIKFILKCIKSLCEEENVCFEYGNQLFRLLSLALSINYSSENTRRITEEIYSFLTIETSTPHLRKFIIQKTEPHHLKLSLLTLIVIKSSRISENYEFDEVNVSCSDLVKILENVDALKNLRYVGCDLQESYRELIYIVSLMIKSFIAMIIEGVIDDAYDEIQKLKSVNTSVSIFCERVTAACAEVGKSEMEELKYLSKMLASS
ncbi:hypothetical protein CHUAL_011195 [Chamberlinius hualienensis]